MFSNSGFPYGIPLQVEHLTACLTRAIKKHNSRVILQTPLKLLEIFLGLKCHVILRSELSYDSTRMDILKQIKISARPEFSLWLLPTAEKSKVIMWCYSLSGISGNLLLKEFSRQMENWTWPVLIGISSRNQCDFLAFWIPCTTWGKITSFCMLPEE